LGVRTMRLPKPVTEKYEDFFADISKGRVKIPQFQRDFVWEVKDIQDLLVSVLNGYYIGSLLFLRKAIIFIVFFAGTHFHRKIY